MYTHSAQNSTNNRTATATTTNRKRPRLKRVTTSSQKLMITDQTIDKNMHFIDTVEIEFSWSKTFNNPKIKTKNPS